MVRVSVLSEKSENFVEPAREVDPGRPRPRLHFLYHELRARQSEYLYAVETQQFDLHLELFSQARKAQDACLWPEVTFDDGHMSDYEHALPVLQSRGMTARFFITVGWTGEKRDYMGWPELRSLHQAGQLIGAHGWSHTLLTRCEGNDLNRELAGARQALEDKLGTSIRTMSLPGGRYNRRVLAACREAGYTKIFTSVPKAEQAPSDSIVGRLNIRSNMTLEWIGSLLQPGSRVLEGLERQDRIKATAKKLLGDRLYEKLWIVVNRKDSHRGDGGESPA